MMMIMINNWIIMERGRMQVLRELLLVVLVVLMIFTETWTITSTTTPTSTRTTTVFVQAAGAAFVVLIKQQQQRKGPLLLSYRRPCKRESSSIKEVQQNHHSSSFFFSFVGRGDPRFGSIATKSRRPDHSIMRTTATISASSLSNHENEDSTTASTEASAAAVNTTTTSSSSSSSILVSTNPPMNEADNTLLIAAPRRRRSSSSLATTANYPAHEDHNDHHPHLQIQMVQDMPDLLSCELQHCYYLLRHGESIANVDSIISSSPITLPYTDLHGLTYPKGYEQAQQSAKQVLECIYNNIRISNHSTNSMNTTHHVITSEEEIIFISSPFARAYQTALICQSTLLSSYHDIMPKGLSQLVGISISSTSLQNPIIVKDQLRERFFGRLDGQPIEAYAYVWPLDQFNVTHTTFDVESVAAVCYRIQNLIYELEQEYSTTTTTTTNQKKKRYHFILVSHADVLQIAQLYAAQAINIGEFSSYRFANGEVRTMVIGTDSCLPYPIPLQPPKRGTQPPPPPSSSSLP